LCGDRSCKGFADVEIPVGVIDRNFEPRKETVLPEQAAAGMFERGTKTRIQTESEGGRVRVPNSYLYPSFQKNAS